MEYGLLVSTIAVLILIGVVYFGGVIETWFSGLIQTVTR